MTTKIAFEERPEAAVLFPEEQVGPYRFRPWSLEQLSLLVPTLLRLIGIMEAAKIPPEEMQARAFELLPLLSPLLPEIIMVTLGCSPEEVEQIAIGHRLALGMRILTNVENQAELKNFLTGFAGGETNPVKTSSS